MHEAGARASPLARRRRLPHHAPVGFGGIREVSDAASADIGRSALAKASWRLLPLIGLGYGVAYMDRINISFAALQMNHDLGFTASIYGFGGGLFFLSYAAGEVPSVNDERWRRQAKRPAPRRARNSQCAAGCLRQQPGSEWFR